jgi:hypothetical protein
MGTHCLYCQIEMTGKRVSETLGEQYDGYGGIAHMRAIYQDGSKRKRAGPDHMNVGDWRALGKFHKEPK